MSDNEEYETFEQVDSGASDTFPLAVNDLKIGGIFFCILLCYFVLFCKYNSFYISSGDIGTSIFLTININSLLFMTFWP